MSTIIMGNRSGKETTTSQVGKGDLPQDYLSPTQKKLTSLAEVQQTVDASSKNSSPEAAFSPVNVSADTSTPRGISTSTESSPNAQSFDEEKNEESAEKKTDLDLSIVGVSLDDIEIQNELDMEEEEEEDAILDISSKDFVRIIHGNKEVMLVMPTETSGDMGLGSLELSETLSSSLGITDEIVGLKTQALLIDDKSSTFKSHGDVVIPFSALASGQLSEMIKHSKGVEGVPSFELVTTNLESYLKNYQVAPSVGSSKEDMSFEEGSTAEEASLYTEAFCKLMEKSDDSDFNPFEKNALLRFGIDNAEQGSIIFRASFRVAVYTNDMSYFVKGLKAIAKVLLAADAEALPSIDENGTVSNAELNLFGLTDFIIQADELFDCEDLDSAQYTSLLNAIFSGHESVNALFDLYHNPDFLLAVDNDEDVRESLMLRDLLHLGKKLEPLPLSRSLQDEENMLKWAVTTGLHNFSTTLQAELPQEFVNIIYHMFSSGDQMVLDACQKMVDTSESDPVEDMLFREYKVYDSNSTFREEQATIRAEQAKNKAILQDAPSTDAAPVISSSSSETALCKASDDIVDGNKDFPDCLLTAVACLVDQNEISEDTAAAILASYSHGNSLVHDIYDHFIEFGGVDDFLSMLRIVAATDSASDHQFGSTRTAGDEAKLFTSDEVQVKEDENHFRKVMNEMKRDKLFGEVEIAALRLAAVRKDPTLTEALADYRDGDMGDTMFKETLLHVCERIIQETDASLQAELEAEQLALIV